MDAGKFSLNGRGSSGWQGGFTLMELLLAIFIFAVVVSSVYGSYNATFSIVHGSQARLEVANGARIVLERFSDDLGSVVKGPAGRFIGERIDFSGNRGDTLTFTSKAHLVLRRGDVSSGSYLVRYQVEQDDETGLLKLYRSDTPLLPGVETDDEDVKKYLLCQGLREFRFIYFDEDGNETDEWRSDMGVSPGGGAEEEPSFPVLVAVELTFTDSKESETETLFKTAVSLL